MKRLVLCILALLPLILPYRSEAAVPVLMYHHIAGNGDHFGHDIAGAFFRADGGASG